MSRILELQNSANFSLIYTNSISATVIQVQDRSLYARLTELIIPVIFDKPIISISINTTVPVGKIWRYAGKISQVIPTALGDSFADDKKALFLGKRNLILFSEISVDYTISYLAPSWFRDVSIGIYQYDGPDTSVIENAVGRIESKIDNLSLLP